MDERKPTRECDNCDKAILEEGECLIDERGRILCVYCQSLMEIKKKEGAG